MMCFGLSVPNSADSEHAIMVSPTKSIRFWTSHPSPRSGSMPIRMKLAQKNDCLTGMQWTKG
jgi:hypothetical protein